MYQLTFIRHGCLHKVTSPALTSLAHLRAIVPTARIWKIRRNGSFVLLSHGRHSRLFGR